METSEPNLEFLIGQREDCQIRRSKVAKLCQFLFGAFSGQSKFCGAVRGELPIRSLKWDSSSTKAKELKDNWIKKEQIAEKWKRMVDFVQYYLLLDFTEDTVDREAVVAAVAIFHHGRVINWAKYLFLEDESID